VNKINWFQHDTDSTQDAKIKKLLIRQGPIGYAVYFHCLELIAADISESNLTFELEHDSEIIADNLKIKGTADKSGIAVVEEIMRDIINLGLFTECQGRVFCIKLLKRISLSMTSSPSFRGAISEKKAKYHDTVMTHNDNIMLPVLPTLPTLPTKTIKPAKESPPDPQGTDAAREVLLALNEAACRYFKPTYSTLKPIVARLNEGFSKEDLISVVDNQVRRWGMDQKMSQYLRPETLFGSKMQGYLQPDKTTSSPRRVADTASGSVDAGSML